MLRYNRKNKNLKIPVGIGTNNNVDSSLLFNVSDGDATAGDLIAGKTAYSAEGFIVGTLDLEGEKTSSYNEGYANGNEIGYNNGYNTGNEIGYNNGYAQGEQDGYVSGEADGYADGYSEGKEDGIEEILTEQSDANITPGNVLEGYIGYGANNERIVGTNVGGYDFTSLGYTEKENADANRSINSYKSIPEDVLNNWNTATTSTANMFTDSKLVLCPKIDTSNVTNMNNMFWNSKGLIYVPDLNTSNVTNMQQMFYGCSSLENFPDFDYYNVTNMQQMFWSCSQISGTFDVSYSNKIENLSNTFTNCKKIEHININAENLITCNSMINSCEGLKSLKITNISSKCTDLEYLTSNLTALNFEYFEISGDTTNVKPYSGYAPALFPSSRKLRTVIIDIDTHFLRKTSSMFGYCELLENIPFFNTSNVTIMNNMFSNCTSLKTIPLFDTSNVTDMNYMFYRCSSLETIPLLNTSNVTNIYEIFYGCTGLKSLPLLDFGSVYDPRDIFETARLNSAEYKLLTDLAGFKDLGKSMNKSYTIDWYNLVALTRQSVVNIFNNLYDLTTTTTQYARISLATNVKVLLSDEDIAIATNKGWIIQ